MLVDGEARGRKGRIGKGAKWNSRNAWPAFDDIGDGRAAIGTEAIRGMMTAVGGSHPSRRLASDGHLRVRPPRLRGEGTPSSLLAVEAVAYRYPDRLAFALRAKLAAATSCYPSRHHTEQTFLPKLDSALHFIDDSIFQEELRANGRSDHNRTHGI